MADIIKAKDGVPIKYIDNGDGSYSEAGGTGGGGGGGGGDASAANQLSQIAIAENQYTEAVTTNATLMDMLNAITANGNKASVSKVAVQTINITGTSGVSAYFNINTKKIVVTASVNCWINIGPSAVAEVGNTSILIPAYTPFPDIAVTGVTDQLAVIADSINGKLSIIESA